MSVKHKLEADSIILEFGQKKVLSDVHIMCETGKITGLLARNGEGKSCLMNIVYGSLEATGKSVRFDNKVVARSYDHPHLLMYLPQFNFIPKSLTVNRVFADYNIDFSEFANQFPEFRATSRIKQLSGGQIRLIELYIILRSKTQFVMLDEPFTHIMPLHVEIIKRLMHYEKENKGIIVTDHFYKDILDVSDQLYVLNRGKTYLTSTADDLVRLGYVKG